MDIINSDDDAQFPQTPPANEDSGNMGSDIEEDGAARQEVQIDDEDYISDDHVPGFSNTNLSGVIEK